MWGERSGSRWPCSLEASRLVKRRREKSNYENASRSSFGTLAVGYCVLWSGYKLQELATEAPYHDPLEEILAMPCKVRN